ncbi:DMT family transporter [Williamsia maris]|uniref:Permease of the drug/metabolite transporter (DMT) superfamily n=1 Tax=Williamsia maris TaxID=72806 RepID=A0ABT1HKU9_9NOCA|nr:DMT family transporter [Williamsia maris]MCP2178577.1 Permease of the drug/metabolite transporter (DMT) superfamily [Williamsia maris]
MRISPALGGSIIVLWSFGYPLGALGITAMSPMLLLTFRFVLSALLMGGAAAVAHARFPRGRQLAHVAVAGLLTQGVQFGCLYIGLELGVPSVIAALLIALNPVVTAVLARPILGAHLGRRQILGLAIGVAAVVAACAQRVATTGPLDAGVALTLVAVLGLSLGGLYQQRFCSDVDVRSANAVQLGVAAVPVAIIAAMTPEAITDPLRAAWVIPVMVLFSSALCTTLYMRAVNQAGAAQAAMLFTVIPSVAAVMGWGMLGQRPDVGVYVGLVLGAAALVIGRSVRPTADSTVSVTAGRPGSPTPRTQTAGSSRVGP